MLVNDRQLAVTREKLRLLEESYEEVRQETGGDEELRDAEMESLKRFINQLKEEIARYEIGCGPRHRTDLKDEREVAATREKLRLLEERYRAHADPDEDEHIQEISKRSLKRMINQLKEEIARYEAHQPARR